GDSTVTVRARDPLGYVAVLDVPVRRLTALERFRRQPLLALPGAALLAALAVGVARAYRRVGREPQSPQMQYPFQPPSDVPPAAVTALLMQRFSQSGMGPGFHATIMDLARRGYGAFTGKDGKFEMELDLSRDTAKLEPFERDVLRYLQRAAASDRRGDPSHLAFKELRRYSQRHASKFMPAWGSSVRRW